MFLHPSFTNRVSVPDKLCQPSLIFVGKEIRQYLTLIADWDTDPSLKENTFKVVKASRELKQPVN